MTRTPKSIRPVVFLVCAGLAVAACSSGKGTAGPNVSTSGVLAGAYQSTIAVHSADLAMDVSVTPATGTNVHLTVSGAIQWAPLAASFQLTLPLGSAATTKLSYRLIGENMYIQIPAALAGETGGKTWLGASLSSLISSGEETALNPADTLALLSSHASSVQKLGPATIGGVSATEYSADIDLSNTAGETSVVAQMLPKLEQMIGTTELPVDVWIDGSGRLVQFQMNSDLQHAPTGASSQEAAAFPIKETVTETLSHYGAAVNVTAPPAGQVMQIDLSQILGSAGF